MTVISQRVGGVQISVGRVTGQRCRPFSYTQSVFERPIKHFIVNKVLVIDDFLANGAALEGLISLIKDSGAELVGAGIIIEKGFQGGGDRLREAGIRLESLAIVESMDANDGSRSEEHTSELQSPS